VCRFMLPALARVTAEQGDSPRIQCPYDPVQNALDEAGAGTSREERVRSLSLAKSARGLDERVNDAQRVSTSATAL
jgi:hypothetical protein